MIFSQRQYLATPSTCVKKTKLHRDYEQEWLQPLSESNTSSERFCDYENTS